MSTERIKQHEDGQWYVELRTRPAGPFETREEAEAALQQYLRRWKNTDPKLPKIPWFKRNESH
jgi:hypothetical protein